MTNFAFSSSHPPQDHVVMMVTGATSGIGESIARHAAKAGGFALVLTGRRKNRLSALVAEFRSKGVSVEALAFDVRDRQATIAACSSIPADWTPKVLINNAGLAVGLGPLDEGEWDDWDRMLDTNIKGLLHVTKSLAPRMSRGCRIVNIGSIAGRQAYPGAAVYNASKFAVDGLTQAMRMDLLPRGIQVIQIAPGAVHTEFSEVRFKGDVQRAESVYQGFQPLVADDVAETVMFAVTRPEHVCIQDLLVMPSDQASAYHFNRSAS
ncbi:MAG: SDR family NAD(P)-dependent oxidoreductase [Flavobacteriales bacterium]